MTDVREQIGMSEVKADDMDKIGQSGAANLLRMNVKEIKRLIQSQGAYSEKAIARLHKIESQQARIEVLEKQHEYSGTQACLDRIERIEFELKVKSEFLSSRQCPDHSGKWQRGDCLQCRIEQLEKQIADCEPSTDSKALTESDDGEQQAAALSEIDR